MEGDETTAKFSLPALQLRSDVTMSRLDARRILLGKLNRVLRTTEEGSWIDGLDDLRQQAYSLLRSPSSGLES